MKNVHLLPTNKPTGIFKSGGNLLFSIMNKVRTTHEGFHLYITSDEEIKFDDYITDGYTVLRWKDTTSLLGRKKVILSTDQDLIADGVQAIDDAFLEWFVKNPSCERVEVIKIDVEQPKPLYPNGKHKGERVWIEQYKIIILKEETKQYLIEMMKADEELGLYDAHKQETLEEKAASYGNIEYPIPYGYVGAANDFINGAKWQAERMYSEGDLVLLLNFVSREYNISNGIGWFHTHESNEDVTSKKVLDKWFEQFKKK